MEIEVQKVNVDEQAARLKKAFTMVDLVSVDELTVSVFLCQGSLAWHRHSDYEELFLVHQGAISLEPGLHPFRAEFFQGGGGALIRVSWSGPGFGKQVLTDDALRTRVRQPRVGK